MREGASDKFILQAARLLGASPEITKWLPLVNGLLPPFFPFVFLPFGPLFLVGPFSQEIANKEQANGVVERRRMKRG